MDLLMTMNYYFTLTSLGPKLLAQKIKQKNWCKERSEMEMEGKLSSPLKYTYRHELSIFPLVWCSINSAKGGKQFPSPLKYIDIHEPSVFSSVWCSMNSINGRGTVSFTFGIHRRTLTVGIFIGFMHNEQC
jgi:hypothetical protein